MSILFPTYQGLISGKEFGEIKEKVLRDFPILLACESCFWPLFNLFLFKKVPLNLQTSVACFGTIVWGVVLSTVENRAVEKVQYGESVGQV